MAVAFIRRGRSGFDKQVALDGYHPKRVMCSYKAIDFVQ